MPGPGINRSFNQGMGRMSSGPNFNSPFGQGRMLGPSNQSNLGGYRNRSASVQGAPGRYQTQSNSNAQYYRRPGDGNGQNPYSPSIRHSGSHYGYRYVNGNFGSSVLTFYPSWGNYYYPYYYPSYVNGLTCLSPYAYYPGIGPLFIGSQDVQYAPPQTNDVPYPLYDDGIYNGYQGDGSNGGSQLPTQQPAAPTQGQYRVGEGAAGQQSGQAPTKDAALDGTLADIATAWTGGNVQKLAAHIQSDSKIAVYLRGRYQYSLDSSDYLDMTRDALRNTKTVSFTLDNVERKQDGLYTVTGKHVYKDERGRDITVNVTYVLKKDGDQYYITQVGTAPQTLSNVPAAQ
jgi:hypothetical protein